ncbi:MAG TPA: Smr/MutS family protein [Pyrinomonadaceae bacterium]|nr:Smr/MutS family protein [Pyrinomonadaceae bacterium]
MSFREWLKRLLDGEGRAGRVRRQEPSRDEEEEGEVDPFDPFPEPVRLEIRDVFDLHTIAPRDVKRVVEEYLEEARRAGYRSVRVIHGKGKGVQREMVRTILARTPFVEDWADAPPEAGGLGATIVHLSPEAEPDA